MEIKKHIIFFIFFSFLITNKHNYNVKLYNISMSNVIMSYADTTLNDETLKKINFETSTYRLISNFFEINNKYETLIDSNFNIKSFKKNTYQPNVSNKIFTINNNDSIFYNNSNIYIPKNHYNIFSLLYYLSITSFANIKSEVNVEREGLFYKCQIKKDKIKSHLYKYTLDFDLIDKNLIPLFIHSDIFTWAIFQENATRIIIVDSNLKKIVKCSFKNGWNKLDAYIK